MLIPIQTMLQGRYQIIRMIAQGGIGAVYEAFDTRLQGRVAIKQLMYSGAAGLQTFEREARMMNSLRHLGLARVSDYFSEATNQFLVMDYIEGNDLAEMLAQRGTAFDVPIVLDWMHQLLTIITYLHNHQPEVLHRDIKPNNIKIAANNHLMLLDFGLSKGHTATQNFSLMGYTLHYAPLEQIQGTGTDARSDIYAIGATIYHLLTNHPPSDALTRASSIIRSQPDPLIPPIQLNPAIPSDLNMMILHMLAQDPMQRPDSAATINHAIQTMQRVTAMATTVINPPPSIQSSGQLASPTPMNTQQPTKTFSNMATTSLLTYKICLTRHLEEKPYTYETGRFFKQKHTGISLVRPPYGTFEARFELTNRHGTNIFTLHTGTITLESIEKKVEKWTDDNWPKRYLDTEITTYYAIEIEDSKKIAIGALMHLESFSKQGLAIEEAETYFLPWLNGNIPYGRFIFVCDKYYISDTEKSTYPYTERCQVQFTLPVR